MLQTSISSQFHAMEGPCCIATTSVLVNNNVISSPDFKTMHTCTTDHGGKVWIVHQKISHLIL